MLIDTHSHLNFAAFDSDRDEVIKRSLKDNVWTINIGSNYYSSKKAVEIAERCEKCVYAAVGLHPINITYNSKVKSQNYKSKAKNKEDILEENFDYKKYKSLAASPKVVAIGEIGLDYWSKPKTKKKLTLFKQEQRYIFLKQLKLAEELNLPIIFHCRLAHDDLLKVLMFEVSRFKLQGAVHCFTGTWREAKKYLEMGLYLGFNGIIFKLDLDEIIKKTPLERILTETDCPFLAPPGLNLKRNEPVYVKYVAQKIAEIKKESLERIAEITTQNASRLFNLNQRKHFSI